MNNQSNNLKTSEQPPIAPSKSPQKPSGVALFIHQVLNGDFFTKGNITSKVLFILFLVALGLIYIGNTYVAELKMRELARLDKANRELKTDYSYIETRLNQKKSPSHLAKELKSHGIQPSVVPPEKIYLNP